MNLSSGSLTLVIGSDHGGFGLKKELLIAIDKIKKDKNYLRVFLADKKSGDLGQMDENKLTVFQNLIIKDVGCYNTESVNYPDYAEKVCKELIHNNFSKDLALSDEHLLTRDSLHFSHLGLLICGSGQGMAMKANKYAKIRAALAWDEQITQLSREHNNANILCLPGRFMDAHLAFKCLTRFLTTPFAQGRHSERVKRIEC